MMSALDERREQLQKVSRDALAAVEGALDAGDIDLVVDFIENYEFRIALELICEVIEKKIGTPNKQQREKLQSLADELNMKLPF